MQPANARSCIGTAGFRDASGKVIRWFGTNTDIAQRQKLEEFQSLLLRELSQRVKNSLSLVSALLHLQARNVDRGRRFRARTTTPLRHEQSRREPGDARGVDAGEAARCGYHSDGCQPRRALRDRFFPSPKKGEPSAYPRRFGWIVATRRPRCQSSHFTARFMSCARSSASLSVAALMSCAFVNPPSPLRQ
jgi:hypothetical protein